MDIQETYTFLDTNFKPIILDYFKKQIVLFKVEPTSKLKDYLDIINDDPVQWLSSLPDDLTCKSAFHKYKEPIYKLIKHTKLHEDYGENYCVNLMNNIKQAFTINCQDIIDKRKNSKKPVETITLDDNSSSETESDDGSELDIDTLEPTDKTNKKDTQHTQIENNNELTNKIQLLQDKLVMQEKYYESIIEYYKTSFNLITNTNEQLMKLLGQIASK
jgi:hypothetical protein